MAAADNHIGKIAHQFSSQGKKVMVGAADTFRAAAVEQLEVWANRVGADLIKQSKGSDPSAVAFDAIRAAKARGNGSRLHRYGRQAPHQSQSGWRSSRK